MHREKYIVDDLISKYHTANPFELCDSLGFKLSYKPLGTLNGLYRYLRKTQFITINSERERHQQTITCAHEIGHGVMHPKENAFFLDSTLFVSKRQEIQADRFAGYLLLEHYGNINCIPEKYLKLVETAILNRYINN